jgi:hypothetical protein
MLALYFEIGLQVCLWFEMIFVLVNINEFELTRWNIFLLEKLTL